MAQSIGPEVSLLSRGGPATPGLLRTINDRVALDLLLEHGRLSRSDIARLTGVSKPTRVPGAFTRSSTPSSSCPPR